MWKTARLESSFRASALLVVLAACGAFWINRCYAQVVEFETPAPCEQPEDPPGCNDPTIFCGPTYTNPSIQLDFEDCNDDCSVPPNEFYLTTMISEPNVFQYDGMYYLFSTTDYFAEG